MSSTISRDIENTPKPHNWLQIADRFTFKRWSDYKGKDLNKEFKKHWSETCWLALSRYVKMREKGRKEADGIWRGLKEEMCYLSPFKFYGYFMIKVLLLLLIYTGIFKYTKRSKNAG